jgi:hypothetical protein
MMPELTMRDNPAETSLKEALSTDAIFALI